jgi:hypothetical protein
MTLRFNYDDTLTSTLVHTLQAIVEEMIFSTDTGNLGICAFPLSSADEFFIIPGNSSVLVLRKVFSPLRPARPLSSIWLQCEACVPGGRSAEDRAC